MNRIALVTGSSSGIGLASAVGLAKAGCRVVATVRDPSRADALEAARGSGADLEIRRLDVTDPDAINACVAGVLGDHGRIDALVNNAGAGVRGTLEQLDDPTIAAAMDLNFWGTLRCARAVIPAMRAQGSGNIVSVTSMNGLIGMPFSDAYNASKFAVEGLMEGLAPVLAQFGIGVSVIEPGPVNTGFTANVRRVEAQSEDGYAELSAAYEDRLRGLFSGGQTPEEVAAVVVEAAMSASPHLRYQSSLAASAMAARKLVDTTGDSVLAATSALIGAAPAR
ncbi:SDR family oxidoreductase [Tomitella biformata]|uniref:SDR family oxidoreductase n=1 Tax=Tomitella biformata TaxID=630403 RepID=UPI0004655E82|nr:SDR family oxidoreductase [Tomitella biformata]